MIYTLREGVDLLIESNTLPFFTFSRILVYQYVGSVFFGGTRVIEKVVDKKLNLQSQREKLCFCGCPKL